MSRGGERHKEIRRLRVRGDLPCRRGRAVAVDHLPMARKESPPSGFGQAKFLILATKLCGRSLRNL